MSGVRGGPRARGERTLLALVAALALLPGMAGGQEPEPVSPILDVEATPIGALPPLALPMPASRNHNYWTFRAQAGNRLGRDGPDLMTVAGGVDLQWRGGSIFGVTAGYQEPDCQDGQLCDGHVLLGARARFNVVTGGPTIASFAGDYSATSTLGAELGFGYAPDVAGDADACTLDLGLPLSVAMLQEVRLVSYVMPSVAWDLVCGSANGEDQSNAILNAGVGVQQLIFDGLDVHLGVQRVFRQGSGYQLGISVTYVHLP